MGTLTKTSTRRSNEPSEPALRAILDRALRAGRKEAPHGRCADYIPELSTVDPMLTGLAIHTLSGLSVHVGDADTTFTLQSVSKVFALAQVMASGAGNLFDVVSMEPSGDAFHSIVRLEEEHGRPRNPLINAGAIVVSERLPGLDAATKTTALRTFLGQLCEQPPGFNEAVYASEAKTGARNRALAHYMGHYGVIESPELAVDTYFRQCSITATARSLATMGLFLANDGVDPRGRRRIVSAEENRRLLALMSMCGLYDEVGRFAVSTGLPAKSGVSGAILAIVPGRMAIAAFGPALGPKGNSRAGLRALELLSRELMLSVYAPR